MRPFVFLHGRVEVNSRFRVRRARPTAAGSRFGSDKISDVIPVVL
jgi:hypothetical protein